MDYYFIFTGTGCGDISCQWRKGNSDLYGYRCDDEAGFFKTGISDRLYRMDDSNGRAVSVIIAFHWAGTDRSADEELLWRIIAIFYGISTSQCPSYFLFCSDGICYLLSEGSL